MFYMYFDNLFIHQYSCRGRRGPGSTAPPRHGQPDGYKKRGRSLQVSFQKWSSSVTLFVLHSVTDF